MGHSKVKLDNKLLYIAVRSVFVYGQVGQSVLIFLPGFAEINSMHSALEDFVVKEHLEYNVDVFVLHSNVPLEDQQAAFESPSSIQMHVILATDIAEGIIYIIFHDKCRMLLNIMLIYTLSKQQEHKDYIQCN